MNREVNVEFNHHILLAKEKQKTADFLTNILGLPDAVPGDEPYPGFFLCIFFKNDVTLLIAEAKEHNIGHYAFKVLPKEFEQVLQRVKDLKIKYWADPRMQKADDCYLEENGNKGFYFIDPSGHGMEILTNLSPP